MPQTDGFCSTGSKTNTVTKTETKTSKPQLKSIKRKPWDLTDVPQISFIKRNIWLAGQPRVPKKPTIESPPMYSKASRIAKVKKIAPKPLAADGSKTPKKVKSGENITTVPLPLFAILTSCNGRYDV